MTNKEWLDYLAHNAPDELAAWFDAEHVETEERALDGDTAAQDGDSREQLEADISKWWEEEWPRDFYTDEDMVRVVGRWLDRQAAITDAEWDDELEQLHMGYKPLIDELQAQVDKLTAERDELQERLNRTTAAMNRAAGKWARANEQCNEYREKFSKCLDYADAIHALMDDEGMA